MSVLNDFTKNIATFAKTTALGVMAMAATSCGGDDPTPQEPGPGPGTGKVTSYSVTGKVGSITFDMADSSFVFWQKVYGNGPSDDKLVQAKISASTKAKGDLVTFENDLIKQSNVKEISGRLVYLNDYNRSTAVFADGKNIGKTSDGKNVIKDMRFDGVESQILVKNADNTGDILNVVNNPNLKWKLEGDKATGYGGGDKTYALKVN